MYGSLLFYKTIKVKLILVLMEYNYIHFSYAQATFRFNKNNKNKLIETLNEYLKLSNNEYIILSEQEDDMSFYEEKMIELLDFEYNHETSEFPEGTKDIITFNFESRKEGTDYFIFSVRRLFKLSKSDGFYEYEGCFWIINDEPRPYF